MKKILFICLILLALMAICVAPAFAQGTLGGDMTLTQPNGAGTKARIQREGVALKVNDSLANVVLNALNGKIPSGLTVNSNRLSIYSPDSIRVFSTTGFGGGSTTSSLDPVDSTNLAGINTKLAGTLTVGSHSVTQSGTWILGANSGVDIGDVTINNASGASAVNIQDGGNSITVDGTVSVNTHAVTQSGTWVIGAGTNNIGDVDVLSLPSIPAGTNNIGDVDVLSSALPTGASTEATLSTLNGKVPSGLTVTSTRLLTDGSGVTQPVSGTVSVSGTVTVGSHAVTNAGTFVVQENGAALTALQLLDDAINTTGSAITTKGVAIQGQDGTNARVLKTDASGELQTDVLSLPSIPAGTNNIGDVDIVSSALPTGASTEATLSTMNGKVPSGLTVNSNRLAVYSPDSIRVFATNGFGSSSGGTSLDATDSSNLSLIADARMQANTTGADRPGYQSFGLVETTPGSVTNGYVYPLSLNPRRELRVVVSTAGGVTTFSESRTPGTESTWSFDTLGRARVVDTVAGTTLSTLNGKVPSGLTVNSSRLAIYSPDSIRVFATNGFGGGSGGTSLDAVDSTNLAGINTKLAGTLTVGTHAVTQSGTWTLGANSGVDIGDVTVNNAAGASAVNIQDGGNSITVDGTVAATQSGTWNINNVSGTVSLPTGAATAAKQPALGTAGTPSSDVITIQGAGGMTAVKTDAVQSGTWNINNVSGTVSLPTGASTEATLSTMNGKVPSGLTVNTNRLAIYSPDSIRVFATNGFGGSSSGGTSLDAVDSTNLANAADSNKQRKGMVIIGGTVTATSDSTTGSRKGVILLDTAKVQFTRLRATTDTVAIAGNINATTTPGASAFYDSTWTITALDTAGLAAKANSATVGWQSDTVGFRQHKATDMKLGVKISFANTAPANDKACYIYACPWWYDGTNWYAASQGTTTLPTGANGTTTIASPNDLVLLGVLSYTTQNQVCQKQFMLSSIFPIMPDAVSFIVINYTGAAIHTSGNLLYYSLVNKVQR